MGNDGLCSITSKSAIKNINNGHKNDDDTILEAFLLRVTRNLSNVCTYDFDFDAVYPKLKLSRKNSIKNNPAEQLMDKISSSCLMWENTCVLTGLHWEQCVHCARYTNKIFYAERMCIGWQLRFFFTLTSLPL